MFPAKFHILIFSGWKGWNDLWVIVKSNVCFSQLFPKASSFNCTHGYLAVEDGPDFLVLCRKGMMQRESWKENFLFPLTY